MLDKTKLEAFAEDRLTVAKMATSLLGRVKNTVGKKENADYQHFSPFPSVLTKAFICRVVKSQDCVVKS